MRLRKIMVAVLFAGAFLQMTVTLRAGVGRMDSHPQWQALLDDLRVICFGHSGVGQLALSELPAGPGPVTADLHCPLCIGIGGFLLSDAAGLRAVATLDPVPRVQPVRSDPVTPGLRLQVPPARGPPLA